jgi:hypothetical protein
MSTETKWTPGPWSVEGETVYALTDTGGQNRFWCSVQSVRRADEGEASDAEVRANAHLIAAAPDLYAALAALMNEHGALTGSKECDSAAEKLARLALSRARGETP